MSDIVGTSGDDRGTVALIGTPDGDWIQGLAGDDEIYPGGGSVWGNTIAPGPGSDRIWAETGTNATFDTLFYGYPLGDPLSPDSVWVDLEAGQAGETDIIGSVTNFLSWDEFAGIEGVVGTYGPDRLRGSAGGNYLEGRGGSDSIEGRGDADTLVGGEGHDLLDGGSGRDDLHADGGNDRLIGGKGGDTLAGGGGQDVFVFQRTQDLNGSYDTITDFVRFEDRIDVRKIDANLGATGNQAFTSVTEATASSDFTAPGQILFYSPAGAAFTFVWLNNDADHFADARFVLSNGEIDLSAPDFVL